jgi:pyruvate/2-oxoacid:ferredoxin oxidoreductase alpha subunit
VDTPGFLVPVVTSEKYRYYKHSAQTGMNRVKEIAHQVDQEFKKAFGRGYGILETIMVDDAEVVLVTVGSMTSTARLAIRKMREEGKKIGLLKLRTFRPFPLEAVRSALAGRKKIAVIDRNFSVGSGGIFCQELKSALIHSPDHPLVFSYIAGIGGTDVPPELIQKIALETMEKSEPADAPEWIMSE